jgi:quercetin dioxygenase-like cupin family protein
MNFPDFIKALPRPDSPVRMDARIIPNRHCLPMFYEIDEDVEVPEHAHGAQWGVVLDGEMEMVIGGDACTYRPGDTYYVPPGVSHITRIKAGYRGIDVFADPDRYLPLGEP